MPSIPPQDARQVWVQNGAVWVPPGIPGVPQAPSWVPPDGPPGVYGQPYPHPLPPYTPSISQLETVRVLPPNTEAPPPIRVIHAPSRVALPPAIPPIPKEQKLHLPLIHLPPLDRPQNIPLISKPSPNGVSAASQDTVSIDPTEIDFIPTETWLPRKYSLTEFRQEFFGVRSSKVVRFEHKLWNALAITKHYPELFSEIGVAWVSRNILKVHRDKFGSLLNLSRPSTAIFGRGGAFMTHGFQEISLKDVAQEIPECEKTDIDDSIVRLYTHSSGKFHAFSTAKHIENCRFVPVEDEDIPGLSRSVGAAETLSVRRL